MVSRTPVVGLGNRLPGPPAGTSRVTSWGDRRDSNPSTREPHSRAHPLGFDHHGSETWESNPAGPAPEAGGPPWTMSLVPRVGYAPTSPALQAGAVTSSAVEGYRVRGSNPPRRFEGPATSPDVERGMKSRLFLLLGLPAMEPQLGIEPRPAAYEAAARPSCSWGIGSRSRNRTHGSHINSVASVPTHKSWNRRRFWGRLPNFQESPPRRRRSPRRGATANKTVGAGTSCRIVKECAS